MSVLGKFVAIVCSLSLVAFLIANVVHSAPVSNAGLSVDTRADTAVQNFFAYHGTKSSTQKTELPDHDLNCKPCAAKAAALQAGGIEANSPAEKVDQPFQRIIGRLPTYKPSAYHGAITIAMPKEIAAWVSLSYGMPFEQVRCRVAINEYGIEVSSISGVSVNDKTVLIRWHEEPPERFGVWAVYLKNGAHDMRQIIEVLSPRIETGKNYGRYRAHSVEPGKVLLSGLTGNLFCDDLEIRLTDTGKPLSMTHMQATAVTEPLQAARQVWLLIDKP